MANCPKCGRKLHIYNWRQECPDCHVNMVYYKSNDRLLEETEKAEIEHAKFQPKVDRAKSATIGQKKGIIRMILFLIPVAALFLPIFSITVHGTKTNYNILGLYNIFSSVDTGRLFSDISVIIIAVVLCLLPAVLGIIFTILQITAGTEKGLKRNIIYSCVSLALAISSFVCINVYSNNPAEEYEKILLREANYLYENGNQSEIDAAVQQIRNVFNDKAVDTDILKKAVENGNTALRDAVNRGYDNAQKTALEKSIEEAKKTLANKEAGVDDIRNAAATINSATAVYNDLETAVKYASLVKNDGSISKKSFKLLTDRTEEGRTILRNLADGKAIVDLTIRNGVGNKSEKDIKDETNTKIKKATADINESLASLVDVSVLEQLSCRLSEKFDNGSVTEADVNVSCEIGIILFVIMIATQLVFNLNIKKSGYKTEYTQCYIGGLPSEKYFSLVEQGKSKDEIYREMLVALAEIQDEAEKSS